ncbi:MAG: formimidoylglutamate deiminase [Thermoanaerobaculia bacterium]
MSRAETLVADWTLTPDGLRREAAVEVGPDGRIARAGPATGENVRRLPGRLLLPGFVNVHSHAFQRGLRGAGERFPTGAGSFWTWREAMYALVDSLDIGRFHDLTVTAFREMRRAGMTAVGEFHYLHHSPAGEDFAFDKAVLAAARSVGIRLVLLQSYYRTGGIDRPLAGGQLRFRVPDVATYWRGLDALERALASDTQTLGIAPHSLRAAPPAEIAELARGAHERRLPLHIHVEEQRQEIADSVVRYGAPPMRVLLDELGATQGMTAVHCTHTTPGDLARYLAGGGRVCLCPLTEGNLGDGHPELPPGAAVEGALCLGTDSNARISMLEEMRWLEYGQRLAGERRGALADASGELASVLLACATAAGADALGLPAGRIAPGAWADFATVDLAHPALASWTPETLLAALVTGCDDEVILETCVGGVWETHRRPS